MFTTCCGLLPVCEFGCGLYRSESSAEALCTLVGAIKSSTALIGREAARQRTLLQRILGLC